MKTLGRRNARNRPAMLGIAVASLLGMGLVPFAPTVAAGHEYVQPVWFNWSHKDLDVLVVAPNDPLVGDAIQEAFDAWDAGIQYWSPTLHSQLSIRYYWPGKDVAPPPNFRPDIVVAPQGFFAVKLAGTLNTPPCYAFAPMMAGWGTLYSVTSHEFGHCLGLDHVFNHGVEYSPAKDIMGNGAVSGGACPSNLNVQVLERVFGNAAGNSVTISSGSGSGSYAQAPSC